MKHVEIKLVCQFGGLVKIRYIDIHLPEGEYIGFDGPVFRVGQMYTIERYRVLKARIIDHGPIRKVRRLSETQEEKISD